MSVNFINDGTLDWNKLIKYCSVPAPQFFREHSPNCSGILVPKYAVVHYTAGGHIAGTKDWCCNPESKVSYHFLIGRDGTVVQMVSLEQWAWHAGKSEWNGITGLNQFSVGIGLCNWGPLALDGQDGSFKPYNCCNSSYRIPREQVVDMPNVHDDSVYRYWEKYPEKQLFSLALLVHGLCSSLPIDDLLGHNEIAPKRKIDPGPAFPLEAYSVFARIARRIQTAR